MRGDVWGLFLGTLARPANHGDLDMAVKDLGRLHDRTQGATQPSVHVAEPDLVTGVHPAKALARNTLEIHAHVAILDLDFVGHADHIKLLGDTAVKVDK